MELKGKVALVTGASGGIGGVIAQRLAAEGATVVAAYAGSIDGANVLVDTIVNQGGNAFVAQLDQRSPESIETVIGSIQKDHGRLDILINNAAWNVGIPFDDLDALTPELWDRVSETNLRGPFLLARASAALLKADSGGKVVNISSIGGITPIGSSIAYSANKAGLNHLTRCLAVAMAPNVTVNCIASGLVENTNMANRAMTAESQQAARDSTLLGKAAQLNDIADQVIAFVHSTSTTGQVIAIDGGVPAAMHS